MELLFRSKRLGSIDDGGKLGLGPIVRTLPGVR